MQLKCHQSTVLSWTTDLSKACREWRSLGSKLCLREPDKCFQKFLFSFSLRLFESDHGPGRLETSKHHYGFRKSSLLCLWFRKCGQKWVLWAHGGALRGPEEVQVQQQHQRCLQDFLQALWKNGSTAEDEVKKVPSVYMILECFIISLKSKSISLVLIKIVEVAHKVWAQDADHGVQEQVQHHHLRHSWKGEIYQHDIWSSAIINCYLMMISIKSIKSWLSSQVFHKCEVSYH